MSDNRSSTSNGIDRDVSLNSSTSLRLSIRIPRGFNGNASNNKNNNILSFHDGELMSPRTTTLSHPSSAVNSKEVPRAALLFSKDSSSSSDFFGVADLMDMSSSDSIKEERTLVEDSIQGLKALAASALASLPDEHKRNRKLKASDSQDFVKSFEINEDEILGHLFTSESLHDTSLDAMYSTYCTLEAKDRALELLSVIICKADAFIQSKSVSMSLSNILPLYIQRLLEQESTRTRKTKFTSLLLDKSFLSASATILLMLPRLISIIAQVDEVSSALGSNLFDVILTIESVLRAIPELIPLPGTQGRLRQLQQVLLEDLVWKTEIGTAETTENTNTLYKLIISEFNTIDPLPSNPQVTAALSGIRSCHKALETLSGFPATGSKVSRLELFFRNYLRLASQRLQFACQRLGLSQSVTQFAWELFVELVQSEASPKIDDSSNGRIELFRNRHLNQIILSVIYCCSRLLDQERTFQQIYQVLPSAQNPPTWLFKISTSTNDNFCDFYTFYNEFFLPPLKKRIERLLNLHKNIKNCPSTASVQDQWLLHELFTSAPLPLSPLYRVGGPNTHVTLNRMNNKQIQKQINNLGSATSITRYEWISPYENNSDLICDQRSNENDQSHILQTPSNTSQLLNSGIPLTLTDRKRLSIGEKSDRIENDLKFKKIARRLDFND